eukprot:1424429-Amphidinium_carterae.1
MKLLSRNRAPLTCPGVTRKQANGRSCEGPIPVQAAGGGLAFGVVLNWGTRLTFVLMDRIPSITSTIGCW